MHSGRQEDADIRVQEPDAHAPAGDEAAVVSRRRQRAGLPAARARVPRPLQLVAAAQRGQLHEPRVLPAAVPPRGRLRYGARLALPARRAPLLTPLSPPLVITRTVLEL